jgi:hypothetical protein
MALMSRPGDCVLGLESTVSPRKYNEFVTKIAALMADPNMHRAIGWLKKECEWKHDNLRF